MLPMPGRIAAKWFGSAELSTATSIGVFGTQLGISVSFLLPPMLVRNHEKTEYIGRDLFFLSMLIAVAASFTLLLLALRKCTMPYIASLVYTFFGHIALQCTLSVLSW